MKLNRAARISLLALIFVSAISLVTVLVTALFTRSQRDPEPSGAPPVTTGTSDVTPPDGRPPAQSPPSESASSPPGETASPPPASPSAPVVTDGMIVFRPPGSENVLAASVDETRFRREQGEGGSEAFFDMSDGFDRSYIEFCYFSDLSAGIGAPSFLNRYIDPVDIVDANDAGSERVGATGLEGRAVSATNGTATYEAWLIDERQGGALAIVMCYYDSGQRDALHAILGSLAIP
jgi:hypothetical protein